MASFDFIHARPATEWVGEKPEHLVVSGLAAGDPDYVAYLADAREVTDSGAGRPISGKLGLMLPAGHFAVSLYSPVAGEYSPAARVEGGQPVRLDLLPFRHDIVIRATRSN